MKKRMKVVDVLASVALIGVVSATVLSGPVGPDPYVPVKKTCPARSDIPNPSGGADFSIDAFTCDANMKCSYAIVYDQNDVPIGAMGVCILEV